MGKSNNKASPLSRAVGAAWRKVSHELFDTYHPERHYMRGPGPKWREKHGLPAEAPAVEHAAPIMTAVHA